MAFSTISANFGLSNELTEVFVFQDTVLDLEFYVPKGGKLVNITYDQLSDGCDIEDIKDIDCFTMNESIDSMGQFEALADKMINHFGDTDYPM